MEIKSYIMYNPETDEIYHCARCVGNALEREFECLRAAIGEPWTIVILDNEDYRDYPLWVIKDKCKSFLKR